MQIMARFVTVWVAAWALLAFEAAAQSPDFAKHLAQARDGDISAMHSVGVAYANGDAAAPDYAEAMRWFEKAALQGQHNSMYSLGIMYKLGQGVPIDLVKAYAWYALAAKYIPKDKDEWYIPRAKVAMYERGPREIAAQLSETDLARAEQLRTELDRQIHPRPRSKQ